MKNSISNKDFPPNTTLQDILNELCITEKEYMDSLAINTHGQQIILRRQLNATQINHYNKHVLSVWKANHDLQFVINARAAVMYASYVLKTEKGMGDLKNVAKESAKDDIKTQLTKAGSVFLTHREVTAQEAVYRALSMPLRQARRNVIFINTNCPSERVSILLPQSKLAEKEDEDDDIYASNVITRYSCRPHSLEQICLAEFVANYRTTSNPSSNDSLANNIQGQPSSKPSQRTPRLKLLNNKGYIYKRQQEAIIRWHTFNKETEAEKHYRALLMLFSPWRDEDLLKQNFATYQEHYINEQHLFKDNETISHTTKVN